MRKFIFLLIFIALINSVNAQWIFDGFLPYDSTLNAGNPDFRGLSIVDSSNSWVIGSYFAGNLVKNYVAKRNSIGWFEIRNHNIDTSIRYINWITAIDTANAWITTSRGQMLHSINGG